MNWSDVFHALGVLFLVMCMLGMFACFLGRIFGRRRMWSSNHQSPRGFSCCGGWHDRRDDDRARSTPRRGADENATGDAN